jgi:hypothetical protein
LTVYFTRSYDLRTPEFYQDMRKHLVATACAFARTRPVYLMRPVPDMPVNVPESMGRAAIIGHERTVSVSLADYHRRHAAVWAAQDAARDQCGVHILDPLPYLCHDGQCAGAVGGIPIYYDDDHLNERGARLLKPMFATVFAAPPQPQPSARTEAAAVVAH